MSDRGTNFFDLYLSGDAVEDEIDDFVERWHSEMSGRADAPTLPQYLGLTSEEYAAWVEDASALPRIFIARTKGVRLNAVPREDLDELRRATRAPNPAARAELLAIIRRRRAG